MTNAYENLYKNLKNSMTVVENSKEYNLAAGEQLVCDTGVVAMMDPTCEMDVRMVGSVKNALFGGEGLVDTVITGPGKVMLQTMPIYKVASAIQPIIVQGK